MLELNTIRERKGARVKKKIVGRGIGSGLGKTCGRGGKGQTARSGVSLNGFEGGQTPIYRRLPKRGFTNIHAKRFAEMDFFRLNRLVEQGVFQSSDLIDLKALISKKIIPAYIEKLAFLSNGKKEALEGAGGQVTLES